MNSVLLQGFYGEKNLGDDYILYSVLSTINKTNTINVTVLANGTDKYVNLVDRFPNLHITVIQQNKLSKFQQMNLIKKHTHWIIGGGGLFPRESTKEASVFLVKLMFAKLCGTKVAIYGVEFNSFDNKLYRMIWRWNFSICDHVIVRNKTNAEMIKSIGFSKVVAGSDVTFAFRTVCEKEGRSDFLSSVQNSQKEYIVWALGMPWLKWEFESAEIGERIIKRYTKLCTLLSSTINSYPQYTHILLPFYDNMDIKFVNDISRMLEVPFECCNENCKIQIDEKRYIFKNAKAAICMRFHSVLFSIFSETPFCAVSYSPKTSSVLTELGLDDKMVLFGVRDSQYFYKEFDIDERKFKELVKKTIVKGDRSIQASKRLKELAKTAEIIIINWLGKKDA